MAVSASIPAADRFADALTNTVRRQAFASHNTFHHSIGAYTHNKGEIRTGIATARADLARSGVDLFWAEVRPHFSDVHSVHGRFSFRRHECKGVPAQVLEKTLRACLEDERLASAGVQGTMRSTVSAWAVSHLLDALGRLRRDYLKPNGHDFKVTRDDSNGPVATLTMHAMFSSGQGRVEVKV